MGGPGGGDDKHLFYDAREKYLGLSRETLYQYLRQLSVFKVDFSDLSKSSSQLRGPTVQSAIDGWPGDGKHFRKLTNGVFAGGVHSTELFLLLL